MAGRRCSLQVTRIARYNREFRQPPVRPWPPPWRPRVPIRSGRLARELQRRPPANLARLRPATVLRPSQAHRQRGPRTGKVAKLAFAGELRRRNTSALFQPDPRGESPGALRPRGTRSGRANIGDRPASDSVQPFDLSATSMDSRI